MYIYPLRPVSVQNLSEDS